MPIDFSKLPQRTLRTWFVFLGEFKLGEIFHADGGKHVVMAPKRDANCDGTCQ